jgi:hypothetical protein
VKHRQTNKPIPLHYIGGDCCIEYRDPLPSDTIEIGRHMSIGFIWVNRENGKVFQLTDIENNQSIWIQIDKF